MEMVHNKNKINIEKADKHLQRQIESGIEVGKVFKPEHETMVCACGYEGKPLCILNLEDFNMFVCPNCGDA